MDRITQRHIPKRQIHGTYEDAETLAHQGMRMFKGNPANLELGNPLTSKGRKVMANMKKQYGGRAKEVFYRSINKKVSGSSAWHK